MRARGGALVLCLVAALAPVPRAFAQSGPTCNDKTATITGTDGPDVLEGTSGHDVIVGLGGDDTIRGLDGADYICGGPGNDTLDYFGTEAEHYDRLPEDRLFGDEGDDALYGDGSWSKSYGGPGDDVFVRGPVSYAHSPGPVLADTLAGYAFGEGRDTLIDVYRLGGSPFSDGFRGTDHWESFFGDEGDDRLIGLGGDDSLAGGAGDDVVVGDEGNDRALDGGEGDDEIHGGKGDDSLAGESFTDAELGDDLLSGGPGRDEAVFRVYEAGGVTVDLHAGTAQGHGTDALESIEDVEGSEAPDVITGDEGPNVLQGAEGADVVSGLGGNDRLHPADFLGFSHRGDVVLGGDGRDTLYVENCCGNITFYGGKGRDLASFGINGSGPGVVVDLAAGTYAFERENGRLEAIEGATGTQYRDVLLGDEGPNFLGGSYGRDVVRGRAGDDLLSGGKEKDTVHGGPGRDRCRDREDRRVGCEETRG